MKEWKENLVKAVINETQEKWIVSLKEVAAAHGISHIKTQEAHEIMGAVLKAVPDYHPVRMMNTPNDSFFQSLCFVENGVEFDSEADFIACVKE